MLPSARAWKEKIGKGSGEADRRGYTGYPEALFYEGVHVADRAKYSHQLLMFRLKALAPEKYRDRKQVEVKEAPVTVVLPDNGRSAG